MKIGVVADPTCDLPPKFLESMGITVLPIGIRVGDRTMSDVRQAGETLAFYRDHLGEKGFSAESVPPDVTRIKQFFLDEVVNRCDFALCLTVTASRSPIFANATKAGLGILNAYKPVRKAAGVDGPFALRVLDTTNMMAGQGALTAETAQLVADGQPLNAIRERIDALASRVHTYMMPNDLYYIRARAKKKGDGSVSFVKYAMGTALNIKPILVCNQGETGAVATQRGFDAGAQRLFRLAQNRIESGLLGRFVCVSYGGGSDTIAGLPGFDAMQAAATDAGITVLTSTMSMTAGVNVGEGALTVGFISEPHEFDA